MTQQCLYSLKKGVIVQRAAAQRHSTTAGRPVSLSGGGARSSADRQGEQAAWVNQRALGGAEARRRSAAAGRGCAARRARPHGHLRPLCSSCAGRRAGRRVARRAGRAVAAAAASAAGRGEPGCGRPERSSAWLTLVKRTRAAPLLRQLQPLCALAWSKAYYCRSPLWL